MKKPSCIDESETWECTAWDTGCTHNTTTKSLVDWDVHAISSHIFSPLAKQVKRNSKKKRSSNDTPHPSIKNFNPCLKDPEAKFKILEISSSYLNLESTLLQPKKVPSKFPEILFPLPCACDFTWKPSRCASTSLPIYFWGLMWWMGRGCIIYRKEVKCLSGWNKFHLD